jgi:REP element-mobilizing transposase RayT
MVITYHAIFTTYGTWLPNDPRGSYSKKIYNDQLQVLGRIKHGRQYPAPHKNALLKFWTAATPALTRQPFFIDESTRFIIAGAFRAVVQRLDIRVRACAIMNDHIHVLVLRSKYRIEYIINQLKGAATQALGLKRTPWTRSFWRVFISDAESLAAAADYICANPTSAGLAAQSWNFVTSLPI